MWFSPFGISVRETIGDRSGPWVVKRVARLWGFRVRLESVDAHERVMQHWEVTPPAVHH